MYMYSCCIDTQALLHRRKCWIRYLLHRNVMVMFLPVCDALLWCDIYILLFIHYTDTDLCFVVAELSN
jgi:hypothetical protein